MSNLSRLFHRTMHFNLLSHILCEMSSWQRARSSINLSLLQVCSLLTIKRSILNNSKHLRQQTLLKDGSTLPPPDTLMRQLIDIANSENPPCSNCDKRDRANMYYCNTCGQALCAHCRDNTHRAKMFATHEILHMTKCIKEPKRVQLPYPTSDLT